MQKEQYEMTAFKRYLIHFSLIGVLAFIVGAVLVINDKSVDGRFLFFLIPAICFYVFPMALFCGIQAEKSEFSVKKVNGCKIDLDRVFLVHPLYKKAKHEVDGGVEYVYVNRYCAWLAGAVTVREFEDHYVVLAPRSYVSKLNSERYRIPRDE